MKSEANKYSTMRRAWLVILIALIAVAVAGCHSAKKNNLEPPTPLSKKFKPTVQVTRLWTRRVGDGAGASGVRLRPVFAEGVLYVASTDGKLTALDAANGRTRWFKSTRTKGWFGLGNKNRVDALYAGGPEVVGDLLAVGTLDGHVYGISAKDGTLRWSATLNSEVITAPAIADNLVIVRTQDGRVYGLDSTTGERRWVYDQGSVPTLSLRGNGPLLAAHGGVFFGSDDGKLITLQDSNGEKIWEQNLTSSDSNARNDIDRLNDADGAILLDGSTLYSAAYHGNLVAIEAPSGRMLWQHPFSTYTSLALGDNALYGVNANSQVLAFDKSNGSDLWKSDAFKYRWLTAPEVQGNYLVVGDMEGYVHWLQRSDGVLAGRKRLSKKPIRAQPLTAGDVVYVQDEQGRIGAYRLTAH